MGTSEKSTNTTAYWERMPVPNSESLRVLVIGAHPDDCDFTAGGVAALYVSQGHHVKFVSVANGDGGHHEMGGAALARRRRHEAANAGAVIGIEYEVMDNHDCEIMPTLELRREIVRLIREFRPDLILTHRPTDYHPDHRYTSQLVHDAAYIVTVPNMVALTDHMDRNPVIMYLYDRIERPTPFRPDVVVDIDAVKEKKIDMLHCHESQMYEWLPYNRGEQKPIPEDDEGRRRWLSEHLEERLSAPAQKYRSILEKFYGPEHAAQVRYAEAFELCAYGSKPTDDALCRLFPFLPMPEASKETPA